jgi:DNA-binding NarL/FixJ family response regulator
LIDERPLVRTAVSQLLQSGTAATKQPGAFLILSFSSVAEFLEKYRAEGQEVDTVALNIGGTSLGDERTRQQIRHLREALPNVPLVLLSDDAEASSVIEALHSGVQGYIPTTLTPSVAMHAIRLVQAGGKFVPPDTLIGTIETQEKAVSSAPRAAPPSCLSEREHQVLELICQGRPNKIIAAELDISESTVKFYVRRIMKKLGATNRTHASFLLSQSMTDGNDTRADRAR